MTEEIGFVEFRRRVNEYLAEPDSERGQERIHDDKTHVSEMWEDGEVTITKSNDLYRRRSLHQSRRPILPDGHKLFNVPDGQEHKRKVVADKDLLGLIDEVIVNASTQEVTVEVPEEL